jgi:hypothetical protein
LAAIFAGLRAALEADRRGASIVDAVLISILLLVVRRLERMASSWDQARLLSDEPLPDSLLPYAPHDDRTLRVRLATDGTHIVLRSRRLYIFGPGPGLGLRPHPRRTPLLRPRIARAPPAGPCASQRDRHPRRQIEAAQGGHASSPEMRITRIRI